MIALGIPTAEHEKYIYQPDWDTSAHVTMSATIHGHKYAPGVQGTWIRLSQAQQVARQLGLTIDGDSAGGLGNVLRDDLFHVFATMANLNPKHTPSDTFGCSTFLPEPLQDRKKNGGAAVATAEIKTPSTVPSASSSNPSSTYPSPLAASSANSKSTPNLSALSSSAPASGPAPGPRKAIPKATLVRQAPSTPLEPGPQPKRRRATIVDGVVPKLSPLLPANTAVKKTGSQSPPIVSTVPTTSTTASIPAVQCKTPLKGPAPNSSSAGPAPQNQAPTQGQASAPSMTPIQKRATRASLGNVGMNAKPIK